jgi:O-antigen ligase
MWAGLLLLVYFVENFVVFDGQFSRAFLPSEYIFLFLGIITIFGIYFYTEKKYNHFFLSKKEIVFACVSLSLIVINIVVILSTPDVSIYEFTDPSGMTYYGEYFVTWQDKLYDCLTSIFAFSLPFILIVVIPRKIYSFKQINFIFYTCLIIAGLAMLYSYIFEWQQYANFIMNFSDMESTEYTVESFFYNRNTYGLFLFICLFVCAYLNVLKSRWYYYLFMGIIFVNMFFTLAKTVLVYSFIFVLVYLFIRALSSFGKHKKSGPILLTVLISLVLIASLIFVLAMLDVTPLFASIHNFINNTIVSVGEQTIGSRIAIWKNCFIILDDPVSLIFGHGVGIFESQLFSMNGADPITRDATRYSHNAFIEMIGKGGLLYLAFYLALIVYSFYTIIKIRKVSRSLSSTLVLFSILVMLAGMIECWYFYSYNTTNLLITIITFVPSFAYYYQLKHKDNRQQIIDFDNSQKLSSKKEVRSYLSLKNIIIPLIGLIGGFLSYLTIYILLNNNYPLWQTIFSSIIMIILLFLVLFAACFYGIFASTNKRKYLKENNTYMITYVYMFCLAIISFLLIQYSIMSTVSVMLFGIILYLAIALIVPSFYSRIRSWIIKRDNKLSQFVSKSITSDRLLK